MFAKMKTGMKVWPDLVCPSRGSHGRRTRRLQRNQQACRRTSMTLVLCGCRACQALNAIESGATQRRLRDSRAADRPVLGRPDTSQAIRTVGGGLKQAQDGLTDIRGPSRRRPKRQAWKEFQETWNAWTKSLDKPSERLSRQGSASCRRPQAGDSKVVAVDDKTFQRAAETRELMLKTLGKLHQHYDVELTISRTNESSKRPATPPSTSP